MIQLCEKAVPLKLHFKSVLKEDFFLAGRKKSAVIPVHKKESKILINTYRPISLFPISV